MSSRGTSFTTLISGLMAVLLLCSALAWPLHNTGQTHEAHDASVTMAEADAPADHAAAGHDDPSHADHCELHHLGLVSIAPDASSRPAGRLATARPERYTSRPTDPPGDPAYRLNPLAFLFLR